MIDKYHTISVDTLNQQIDYYSRQLRLPAFRNEYEILAQQTAKNNQSFEQFLLQLMIIEYTIITNNLGFDRWTEIFGDEILTAAMVDRLTHKAILVNMNGNSFRVKESLKLFS